MSLAIGKKDALAGVKFVSINKLLTACLMNVSKFNN